MMKTDSTIRIALPADAMLWNSFVLHPLQSWEWGNFRSAMGVDVARLIDEKNHDAWQITFHKIPHTPWTIGYFPKGPSPDKKMITELTKLGRQKHAIFIQLEPDIQQKSQNFDLRSKILRPSHHPLFTKYTFVLDLSKSEEELQKSFHSKTRYNIKVAQKHGVEIKKDDSPKAFHDYLALSAETTGRQEFYAHSRTYHERMWQIMHAAGLAHLFTAVYHGETLASWIVFCWGKRLYYPYGASSRSHREVMAPSLLIWEIIRWAKAHDFISFDLWGAMGPNPDPNDPWFGFHRFKAGFNPLLVEHVGSFDLILHPFLYSAYRIADIIRWRMLHLKSKLK